MLTATDFLSHAIDQWLIRKIVWGTRTVAEDQPTISLTTKTPEKVCCRSLPSRISIKTGDASCQLFSSWLKYPMCREGSDIDHKPSVYLDIVGWDPAVYCCNATRHERKALSMTTSHWRDSPAPGFGVRSDPSTSLTHLIRQCYRTKLWIVQIH